MKRECGLAAALLFSAAVHGQFEQQERGLVRGNWILRPSVFGLGAYDSRVIRTTDDAALSDVYAELGASAVLNNLGGQYGARLNALYAYRVYGEYNELNDDRYNLGFGLSQQDEAWSWSVNTYLRKSLDYDTTVDLSGGKSPGEVLTDETRQSYSLQAGTAYRGYISDRSSLTPGYSYNLFYESADILGKSYWQRHTVDLQYGYSYSDKTTATLAASYTIDLGRDEDGRVARVMVGAAGQATDSTDWTAQVGLAAADYERSGADVTPVFNLRGTWRATDKVSAYVFGGNGYGSGYGTRGARLTARLGYGANWNMRERWSSSGQILHSRDIPLGAGQGYPDMVKTFITANLNHLFSESLSGALSLRYIRDEYPQDNWVASMRVSKKY